MTFADLSSGDGIFLDANPLVYYFGAHALFGPTSKQLIERIEKHDLLGFTSTHVLSEAAHHLMTLEAASVFGWTSKVVQHLKNQPANIQKLVTFRQAVEKVPLLGIQVLTIPPDLVATAAAVSQHHALLSNDALLVAVMHANGLTNLASNDADFDRVPGLTRYAPA
jgi:predicted nucleic acid-binding protein